SSRPLGSRTITTCSNSGAAPVARAHAHLPGSRRAVITGRFTIGLASCCVLLIGSSSGVSAQIAPSAAERAAYTGLFAAAARGDADQIVALIARGAKANERDGYGRTPLHVTAYAGHHAAMRALVVAGAEPDALERGPYGILTIGAVAHDVQTPTEARAPVPS